jgi:hypothetical protein
VRSSSTSTSKTILAGFELDRDVGFDLARLGGLQVDRGLAVGERVGDRDRPPPRARAGGVWDGDAAGLIARGLPVVGRDVADGAMQRDRPPQRVQVVRDEMTVGRLDLAVLALGVDRGARRARLRST